MVEEHRAGIHYLEAVTTLMQRVRSADPTAGIYEAADFQWWWRQHLPTYDVPQLFWIDDTGRPEAAVIATDWGETIGLDPIVMPGASPSWTSHVVERGLAHASECGFTNVDFVIDRDDNVMAQALAGQGFTETEPELVDAWLSEEDRPAIRSLDSDYQLLTRLETLPGPHHMAVRSGPEVEQRLNQTPFYRADLDLVILDGVGNTAAYGMFWLDPETATGLVEPMRTEEEHQRRGLAGHILTSGLNRLFDLGARRVKIAWDPKNGAAHRLYTDVGFTEPRECVLVSQPTTTGRRY